MDEIKRAAAGLVEKMTLEEKTSLLSGFDFWRLKGVERLGIPMIAVSDGPHGLRKQPYGKDQLGINGSSPATCFPTAATTACSFDRALLGEIGRAIGEECCEEDIAVILGPGLNIKRSPLCGRNFEYFSEDPCLAGELAAAYTAGVQSMNVGVSCKHFALNSQETRRMSENSVCDERAMREIYLAGFERAVKEGRPWTVMSSYNRVNGTYACENQKLLTDILRREWGFDGLVVSDWGGMDDRAAAVRAGNDLEMPGVTRETTCMLRDRSEAARLKKNMWTRRRGASRSLSSKACGERSFRTRWRRIMRSRGARRRRARCFSKTKAGYCRATPCRTRP